MGPKNATGFVMDYKKNPFVFTKIGEFIKLTCAEVKGFVQVRIEWQRRRRTRGAVLYSKRYFPVTLCWIFVMEHLTAMSLSWAMGTPADE